MGCPELEGFGVAARLLLARGRPLHQKDVVGNVSSRACKFHSRWRRKSNSSQCIQMGLHAVGPPEP